MTDMPHNQTAEAELLGALLMPGGRHMLDGFVRDYQLSAVDFYIAPHRRTFEAILELADGDNAISATLVVERLRLSPLHVGDPAATIDEFLACAAPFSQALSNVRLLKDLSRRRTWFQASVKLKDAAADDNETLVADAERLLHSPTVSDDTTGGDTIGHELVDWLESDTAVGITTGFDGLDNIIGGGLRPGDTTALGAWTGMGKSALVDQILTGASRSGLRCHAYVNEMSLIDRGLRMIARTGVAPYSKLVVRDLDGVDWDRLIVECGRMPFGISEVAQWEADRIARHIRANRWDLCVLDHLHNIPYRDVAELDHNIDVLSAAALSSGTHLLMVCQFNQERAKSELLPQPVMRDMRGSGKISMRAATVLLLHRHQDVAETGIVVTTNDTLIKADKARHGVPGRGINAEFDPDLMSFFPAGLRSAA